MVVAGFSRKESSLKFTAAAIAAMLVISSTAMIGIFITAESVDTSGTGKVDTLYQSRPFEVRSVPTADGSTWEAFDARPPGTPAEVHVTISDTSGITIVADIHGFWRISNATDPTDYDDLEIPGARFIQEPGAPMLPSLFEYVEIPRNVDVSVEVLASSSSIKSGYNIRPAPPPNIPVGVYTPDANDSLVTSLPSGPGPVYSNDTFFPGNTTSTEGESRTASLVMRGHRLLALSVYPIHYNPVTHDLMMYSQLVIKLKYSIPSQIQPVAGRLRAQAFERILFSSLLNYDSCSYMSTSAFGAAATQQQPPPGFQEGAEHLIITTQAFKFEADRLAEWKEKKGVPSKVVALEEPVSTQDVKDVIQEVYDYWYPAPTYVLLLGDVESIPANYDADHEARIQDGLLKRRLFDEQQHGIIASDLGYFTIDGDSYIPDMIYGRISVDTKEQARTVVGKILQYEQYPPREDSFYQSMLAAGHFEDRNPLDGVEDEEYPFIYTLENIRHYLNDTLAYNVHINYSCPWLHYDSNGYDYPYAEINAEELEFSFPLDPSDPTASKLVIDSLPEGHEWLSGYTAEKYYNYARSNITSNINDGRFFVYYFSHGGSKNMVYPININGDNRDFVEGWHVPTFNTTYFVDLTNGNRTPLIVTMACNTGWFDGERDQDYMTLEPDGNVPFLEVDAECFAEDITRLEDGGAVAAISASRPAYAGVSGSLLNGIIQAFWPGFKGSTNQPMYEMGAALLYGKLYAKSEWTRIRLSTPIIGSLLYPEHKERTTFEEYHLFGDPETQLWTDVPSQFNVSYPVSIGRRDPQRFVVTVRDNATGVPVDFARVCVQQKPSIYQVGYTDSRGQVTFDVAPSQTPSHVNVTVTKHNFEPHQGVIVVKSRSPVITLSEYSGAPGKDIIFTVSGFDTEYPVQIFMDADPVATVAPDSNAVQGPVPDGPAGYVNVWAGQEDLSMAPYEPVATTRFFRQLSTLNPDPYIYCQNDPSTWHLAGGQKVWDNPCIAIYDADGPVTEVGHDTTYQVKVTVYNRGTDVAARTNVTLAHGPLGGGVSWTPIGKEEVTVNPSESGEVTFSWRPLLPNTVSLRVSLDHGDEGPEEMKNNIGYETVNVIPLCSPGSRVFHVGNPTNSKDYVLIKVKQQGNYSDVWNATILDYSSQALIAGEIETVTLLVDPGRDIESGEGRPFIVEIYINCRLLGGIAFDATIDTWECGDNGCCWLCLLILGAIIIALVIICYRRIK